MLLKQITILILFCPLTSVAQGWTELNDAGLRQYKQGEYQEAEKSFSLAMQSAATGEERATSLSSLGYCQQALGNYPAAQQSFRQCIWLTNNLYPALHIERIEVLINLANAFLPAGQYDSCEYYILDAEKLLKESVSQQSAHYLDKIFHFYDASISVQNTLASLAYKKGQFTKAVQIMEQQQRDIKAMYPDNYRSLSIYNGTLNNLSTYYNTVGDYQKAKRVTNEHVEILSQEKNNLSYLYALNNLGSTYRNLEQYDSAILIYKTAIQVLDTSAYRGTDLHIALLNNIGELLYNLEDYPNAIASLQKSISLQESRAGQNPRIYQSSLHNLAEAYYWSSDFQQAEQTYRNLTTALSDEILHNYTYLSDAEKISFFRSNVSVLERFSIFAFELSGEMNLGKGASYTSRAALNDLFNLLMATKGIILHPGLRLKNNILTSSNTELRSNYNLWEDKKYAYANEARRENADPGKINKLSQEIETLEKWLRANSAAFQKGFVPEKKTWQDVQRSLAPNEAAVEVVRMADGVIYGALILTHSTVNGPGVALVKSTRSAQLEKQFYKNYSNSIQFDLKDSASFNTFWKPIRDAIERNVPKGKRIDRVYFSSDGVFNKINLNTLYDPSTREYLIKQLEIIHVTNLKEIIPEKSKAVRSRKTAVLFGRPQFYLTGKERKTILSDLPGTEKEVNQIDSILRIKGWQTGLYKFEKANEGVAKALQSPGVLHFATHGFVVQDSLRNDLADLMLNAGIVLAGAGTENSSGDDGILTAYELMSVDLDNTQLVVLSACETGLGEYYNGEGVYGLQRAIRSAGSKSTIMSLWKVDDDATQKLMTLFYKTWLRQKTGAGEAFRTAQLELMKTYPQPKYWGAFVFGGK